MDNFIKFYENQNENIQNDLKFDIIYYLQNKNLTSLFEDIEKYIVDEVYLFEDFLLDVSIDYKFTKEIINNIVLNILKLKSYNYKCNKILHLFEFEFFVSFEGLEFEFKYVGDIYGNGNVIKNYVMSNNNIDNNVKRILKSLFIEDVLFQKCLYVWSDVYLGKSLFIGKNN